MLHQLQILTLLLLVFTLVINSCSPNNPEAELYKYARLVETKPKDDKLVNLPFETKYKVIEKMFNKQGLFCKYTYEEIADKLANDSFVSNELMNPKQDIARLSYYIMGLWGSRLNFPTEEQKANFLRLSDQIWFFSEQDEDLNYTEYTKILHEMRAKDLRIEEWQEEFLSKEKHHKINFQNKGHEIEWIIPIEVYGSMNNVFFKKYTDVFKEDFIDEGNYFVMMDGEGGIIMFLTYEAEKYIRKLWNFAKLNARGQMMTISEYSKL